MPTTGAPRTSARSSRPAARRLVDVDDVEVAGAQLAAHRGRRPSGKTARLETAPLAPKPIVRPSGIEVVGQLARLGGGAVQQPAEPVGRVEGGEHAHVMAAAEELLGQRLDVTVHAPLIGPGIWRDKGDAHRAKVRNSGRAAAARPGRPDIAAQRQIRGPDHEQQDARVVGERADRPRPRGAEEPRAARPARALEPGGDPPPRGDSGDEQEDGAKTAGVAGSGPKPAAESRSRRSTSPPRSRPPASRPSGSGGRPAGTRSARPAPAAPSGGERDASDRTVAGAPTRATAAAPPPRRARSRRRRRRRSGPARSGEPSSSRRRRRDRRAAGASRRGAAVEPGARCRTGSAGPGSPRARCRSRRSGVAVLATAAFAPGRVRRRRRRRDRARRRRRVRRRLALGLGAARRTRWSRRRRRWRSWLWSRRRGARGSPLQPHGARRRRAPQVADVFERRLTLMAHTFIHPVYPELLVASVGPDRRPLPRGRSSPGSGTAGPRATAISAPS